MNKLLFSIAIIFIIKAEAQSSALELADSLYTYGEHSKAIKTYKRIEDASSEVLTKIAKSYIAIGYQEAAMNYYEKAILKEENHQLYKLEYAKLLSINGQLNKSEEVFKDLVLKNEFNSNYHYQLGLIKQKRKDSTAIKYFLKAFELDPNHIKTINKIGRYNLKKRKYDDAINIAKKGLVINANSKELASLKAQAYYWKEDYTHAKQWFLKRLELGEPNQFIYEKLSYCFQRDYEFKESIFYLQKALKFDPKNGTILFKIGRLYMQLEDFSNAEKYMKQALEILDQPLDREYTNLASALNRQQKYKEAIATYKEALRHNPKNDYVPFFMVHTKAQYYKDVDAKIDLYTNFIKKYPESKFKIMAEQELERLKEEQFMKKN